MSPRGQTGPKERRNSIDTCSHGTGKEVSPQGDLYSRQLQAVPYVRPGDAVIDMSGYGGRSERLDSHVTGTLPAGLALWNGVSTTGTTKSTRTTAVGMLKHVQRLLSKQHLRATIEMSSGPSNKRSTNHRPAYVRDRCSTLLSRIASPQHGIDILDLPVDADRAATHHNQYHLAAGAVCSSRDGLHKIVLVARQGQERPVVRLCLYAL